MLTMPERKRLAREARKLATECAEGTAPAFDPTSYCGCAIGEILARTGSRPSPESETVNKAWHLAVEIDGMLPDEQAIGGMGLVSNALIDYGDYDGVSMHSAVVFPLLALADALEAE